MNVNIYLYDVSFHSIFLLSKKAMPVPKMKFPCMNYVGVHDLKQYSAYGKIRSNCDINHYFAPVCLTSYKEYPPRNPNLTILYMEDNTNSDRESELLIDREKILNSQLMSGKRQFMSTIYL